jgi:hypothetical protein
LKTLARLPRVAIEEVLYQEGNVLCSLAQGRHVNWKNVQPVEQVAPKPPVGDGRLQVAIRRRNHPNICADGSRSADTLKLAFLENTQQSDLGFPRKLSHFIEEDRTSSREFEAPQTALIRPCESAFLMAEQFRRDQVARDRRAIHTHKRV